jgi:hypothetical protein
MLFEQNFGQQTKENKSVKNGRCPFNKSLIFPKLKVLCLVASDGFATLCFMLGSITNHKQPEATYKNMLHSDCMPWPNLEKIKPLLEEAASILPSIHLHPTFNKNFQINNLCVKDFKVYSFLNFFFSKKNSKYKEHFEMFFVHQERTVVCTRK